MASILKRFVEARCRKVQPTIVAIEATRATTKGKEDKDKGQYKIGQVIGRGSFSEVRMIRNKAKKEDKDMAVKIIQKQEGRSTDRVIHREIRALRKLNHPNIIEFHEVLKKGDKVFIIMEYVEGGNLFQKLDKYGAIPDHEARRIFAGIASALNFCHQQSIAHRDLKLENVLLDKQNRPKITDFGFSRSCLDDSGKRMLCKTFCGSLYYACPEILMGAPYNPTLADVWSAGVVLYAMVFNAMPFLGKNVKVLVQKQLNKETTFSSEKGVSESCIRLIKWMLEPDLIKRATIGRVLGQSEWLKSTE